MFVEDFICFVCIILMVFFFMFCFFVMCYFIVFWKVNCVQKELLKNVEVFLIFYDVSFEEVEGVVGL